MEYLVNDEGKDATARVNNSSKSALDNGVEISENLVAGSLAEVSPASQSELVQDNEDDSDSDLPDLAAPPAADSIFNGSRGAGKAGGGLACKSSICDDHNEEDDDDDLPDLV